MKRRLEDEDFSKYQENWMCSIGPAPLSDLYPCFLCEKILLSSVDLRTHLDEHSSPQSSLLKDNSVTTAISPHLPSPSLKKFYCDFCGQPFENISDLRIHQIRHFGEEKYKCLVCLKLFSSKAGLHRHQKVHNKEKSFLCTRCPKIFTNRKSLQFHLMAHDGKRPHMCSICQQPFTQQASLRKHQEIHTGICNFKCLLCNASFRQQRRLINHHKLAHN